MPKIKQQTTSKKQSIKVVLEIHVLGSINMSLHASTLQNTKQVMHWYRGHYQDLNALG